MWQLLWGLSSVAFQPIFPLSFIHQLLTTGSIDGSIHVWVKRTSFTANLCDLTRIAPQTLDERPDKPVQLRGVPGNMAAAMNGLYEATGRSRCTQFPL
jgi:hypothetical protein